MGTVLDVWVTVVSALVAFSILLVPIAARMRAPILLVFLALGILLGEDGPGGIIFDNYTMTFQIGSLALALILLSGGLETKLHDITGAEGKAAVLASAGVVLTMLILGGGVYVFTHLSLLESLLIGAVLSATDAAATFMLLGQLGLRLKNRLGEILSVESGFNDPVAIFLTVSISTILAVPGGDLSVSIAHLAESLTKALGLGLFGGIAGGLVIPELINRTRLSGGLAAVFVLAFSLVVFTSIQFMGGSGYLSIYLCGLITRSRLRVSLYSVVSLHDGMAWLAQIVLFLMLGLLVKPHDLPQSLGTGIIVAGLLMIVARPLAVSICLAPFRTPRRECLFLGWVGLRGAVPIVLTIIPLIGPGPVTAELFNIVFVTVLASLLLQGWTIPLAARWLDVAFKEDDAP